MAVQFAKTKQGLDLYNSNMRHGDARRDIDDRRMKEEGVDDAVRAGLGGIYANRQPQVPVAPAAGPVAAPAPTGATAMPVAAPQMPQEVQLPPQTGGDDVIVPDAVATANATPAAAYAPQGGGNVIAPSSPMAGFSATTPPTQPQAPTQPTSPAAQANAGSSYAPMMDRLSRTPGAGSTMLQLHERDQTRGHQNERLRATAEIQAIKALQNAEPQIALALSQRYGLNIPPEIIKSAQFQNEMKQLGNLNRANGITDDNAVLQITRQYMDARQQGMDERAATALAYKGVTATAKPGARSTVWSPAHGAFVEHPSETHPNGRTMAPPDLPARQTGGGRGGAGGSVFEKKQAAWLSVYPGDSKGALEFAGGRRSMTRDAAMRAATALAKARAASEFDPEVQRQIFDRTYSEALAELQAPAGGGSGAPRPAPARVAVPPPAGGWNDTNDPLGIRRGR